MLVENETDQKQDAAHLAFQVARELWIQKPHFVGAEAKKLTAELGEVSIEDLIGPHKFHPLVSIRQAGMVAHYLASPASLPMIGRQWNRDHSTIVHAFRALMPHLDAPVRASSAYLWFQDKMEREARAVA